MKILKPGKVERRKFVCPNCECEFVCDECDDELFWDVYKCMVPCPTCKDPVLWDDGKPYEEPKQGSRPKETDEERLSKLIMFADEFYTSGDFVDYLIAHGVTFKEMPDADDHG